MNTLPAQEIKRRGISAVDEAMKDGPVHVIQNNRPKYVVVTEEHYQELVQATEAAYIARVKTSLEDIKTGRTRKFASVDKVLKAIEEED